MPRQVSRSRWSSQVDCRADVPSEAIVDDARGEDAALSQLLCQVLQVHRSALAERRSLQVEVEQLRKAYCRGQLHPHDPEKAPGDAEEAGQMESVGCNGAESGDGDVAKESSTWSHSRAFDSHVFHGSSNKLDSKRSSYGTGRDMSPPSAGSDGGSISSQELVPLELWNPARIVRNQLLPISRELTDSKNNEKVRKTCLESLMLPPESRLVLFWDLFAVCCLSFDALNTPLIAFREEDTAFDFYMDFFMAVFWSFDIIVSFFRGRNLAVAVEMRPRVIARLYLKGYFGPDLVIALLDWFHMLMHEKGIEVLTVLRSARVVRLLRTFRLLRLVRSLKLSENLDVFIQAAVSPSLLVITKSILMILFLNHLIACLWYYVGTLEAERSWVTSLDEQGRDISYRYSTALHWSVTQFTPASTDVNPRSTPERIMSVVVILVAVAVFSTVVSKITATLTGYLASAWKQMEQRHIIFRYIAEHNLSTGLRNRVMAFITAYRLTEPSRPRRQDIVALRALPKRLRLMMDWEINSPVLKKHPFFDHLGEVDAVSMLQICSGGLLEQSLAASEELFHCGKTAEGMYFTTAGAMQFYLGLCEDVNPTVIQGCANAWLSEPALWMKWTHSGQLVAVTVCDFLKLSPAALHSIIKEQPKIQSACITYSRRYLSRLARRAGAGGSLDGSPITSDLEEDIAALVEMAHNSFAAVVDPETRAYFTHRPSLLHSSNLRPL